MTKTENQLELCKRAAKSLQLNEIILFESRFERPGLKNKTTNLHGVQEDKRIIKYDIQKIESNEAGEVLSVIVSLGSRIVIENEGNLNESNEPSNVLFYFEADYLIQYKILAELQVDEIKAFSNINAVHNVWPFWRQHVYNLAQQARLSPPDIPLYSID